MRKTVVLALAAAAALGLGVAHAAAATPPPVGGPAPEISADYWLNSPALTLKALRGKIVVVEFWATWCPPCRKSIPHLIELSKQYGPKGVVFIGMSDEPQSKVEPFVKEMGMTYVVAGGSRTGGEYGVTGIPTAFVVDTSGTVAWNGHPMDDGFVAAIDEQLKKSPPKTDAAAVGAVSLDDVAAALQKAQYGRAAALLAKFEVPEGDAPARDRVDRMKKTLAAQAPARLVAGEKSLAAKEYYPASEAFRDVLLMASDTPLAKKAEDHLAKLQADDSIKAQIAEGREKAASDLLADALKRQKANPAAALKALGEVAARFPDTKAGAVAAQKAKALAAKMPDAK